MIEVRQDQMQVFQEKVRASFVRRVRSYLREKRREWVASLDDKGLDALIRSQVIAAESFGIATETGVVRFIEVGLALGEDFSTSGRFPEAERVLHHAGMNPEKKLQQLEEIAGKVVPKTAAQA
jgi:hypothetical protein